MNQPSVLFPGTTRPRIAVVSASWRRDIVERAHEDIATRHPDDAVRRP
jgi:6,7-dimethyl-8-ribityllumazine synthase